MARNYGGGLSPYYTAAENTLEQYVPMPFQEMMVASNAIQARAEAIENQKMATDSLLANIEALSPEHRSYVQKQANSFRQESSALLDQFGGNAADPEYIRKQRQLIMQHANDGNFRTIASANERLKFNDNIARKMRAEGKLFTRPIFNGLDSEGNLTDNVGEIEYVNTLDKLAEEYKIAWGSMENNNKGTITNKANIDRQNARVMEALKNRSPEFTKLATAYMQQGMTADEASRKIQSDIMGLQGQYGIRSERDAGYYNYQLAQQEFGLKVKEHRAKMASLTAQMNPQNPNIPLQGVMIEGAISAKDINKDKKSMLEAFRPHIGKDGNLAIKEKVLQSGAFGAHAKEINRGTKIQDRSIIETLNYMRTELGLPLTGKNAGSAKQVADMYESMIKNDNIAPVTYVPGNTTIYNGIDRTYGNNFEGAFYYEDGKRKKADKGDIAEQIHKNKRLVGLSFTDGGSVIYKSTVDGKPVNVTIPLDTNTKLVMRNNLHLSSIQNDFSDNEGLQKAVKQNPGNYLVRKDGNYYSPRITANGLRYAKVNVTTDGKIKDFDRDNDNQLMYIPDNEVKQYQQEEFNFLDSYLKNIFKGIE